MKASLLQFIKNLPNNIIKSLVNNYVDNTIYGSTSKNQDYRTLAAVLFSVKALTDRFRLNGSNTPENASSHHSSQNQWSQSQACTQAEINIIVSMDFHI